VAVDSTAEQLAARAESPYLLVTGLDGRPLGWSEPDDLTAGAVDTGRLLPHGRPFVPGKDSLRAALDCAVLSPTGWAVAVDDEGRAVGVVSQQTIGEAIRGAHAAGRQDAAGREDAASRTDKARADGRNDAKVAR
jgi:osmoprotectant transport system ATP-binding protein